MSNPGMRLTRAGKNILAQGLLGDEIHFTKIAFGDADFDYSTENLQDLTALKSWRLDLPIIDKRLNGDGTVTIVGLCTNFYLTSGFRAKEIGIFAIDQTSDDEILYAYRNAGEEYSFIPARSGVVTKSVRYAYQVEIGDADNVTFDINFSFAYVSQEDFQSHVDDENPHPQLVRTQRLAWENRQIINAQAEIPFDANLIIFEDFKPSTCDELKIQVTNCVSGANLITLTSIDGVKIGETYFICDENNFEEVKITSVMRNSSGLHVKTSANLTNAYDLTQTYLYRSTFNTPCLNVPLMSIEIFTKKETADVDLKQFAAVIRHSELIDTEISATAYIYPEPQIRENILLGTGGVDKLFSITDANISNLEVRIDDVITDDYYFETDNAYVKLTAPTDSTITASYIFNTEPIAIDLAEISTSIECDHYITRLYGETSLTGYKTGAMRISFKRLEELLPQDQPKILRLAAGFGN